MISLRSSAAWGWGLAGFALFFYQAQFIQSVKWNAIELIIAQHLIEHGTYATSLDYPSSITWRPVLPTLVVAFFRLWTADPILIYQLVCGVSLGTLTATMFLSARKLWSVPAAHAAAIFTLLCPAITTYLIGHLHSYSHIVALLFIGPAIYVGIRLLTDVENGKSPSGGLLGGSGILWGCCYLCRTEMLLFAVLQILLLGVLLVRRKLPVMRLAACVAGLLVLILPFNLYASRVAERDGLLLRKLIYGFYTSQGWVDPAPDAGSDIEGEGFVYAKKLYGEPLANNDSVIRAVANNPSAFLRRIKLNALTFYRLYWERNFFHPMWSATIVAVVALFAVRRMGSSTGASAIVFLAGVFLGSHFILLFHIDPRYVTINIPALILLLSGWVYYGFRWAGDRRIARAGVVALFLAFAGITAAPQLRLLRERPSPAKSMAAMKSLGEHFRANVPTPRLVTNREPHIGLELPEPLPIYPEDPIILGYFTHSAWLAHGAEAAFPRGRLYSFRECPDDYLYVPADKVGTRPGKVIATYTNPILGPYSLLQLNP